MHPYVGSLRIMLKDSAKPCTPIGTAVSPQQSWRTLIKSLILPKGSSREREYCQKFFLQGQKFCSEEEKEEEEGSSSEEGFSTCNDVPFRINKRLRCIGCNKRRPSFSDTESVLDIIKMPVGTTSPVLKSSFSLTSLRSSTPTDSSEHGTPLRLKTERAYHSLTKKSRQSNEQDKEQWRKSWGSVISQDGKEFWEGFQADYDYLMAQNILDRDVSEVPVENGIPRTPPVWSHSEFMDYFAQLYSWLKSIQDSVYGKEENVTDWKLRAERLEDMQRQRLQLDNFKEESRKLIARYPDSEGEVLWRVKHISDKWESIEGMMGGCQKFEGEKSSKEKVEHEIRCVRKWLRDLDTKLKPLSFQRGWTKAELEAKAQELKVLHRDIEGQKKIFSSLCKLCEKGEFQKYLVIARALQRKYYLHYLTSLEWKLHIESLIDQQNKSSSNVSNESDGEPVPKVAKFTRISNPEIEDLRRHETEESDVSDDLKSGEKFSQGNDSRMETSVERKDKETSVDQFPSPDTMVGAKAESSDGLGGFSSILGTKSKDANILFSSANQRTDSKSKSAGRSPNGKNEFCLRDINTAVEPEINRSKERPPNTGSFTCKHLDTDSEQERAMTEEEARGKINSRDGLEGKDVETTSSEGGWTYRSSKSEAGVDKKPKAAVHLDFKESDTKQLKYFSARNIPPLSNNKKSISSRKLVELADELVRCKPVETLESSRGRTKKGSKEKILDSCDASSECTEDSDEWQKSDDYEISFASSRMYGSADGILEGKIPFEFVPRRPRYPLRHRPLSMSRVSRFKSPRDQGLKSQASVSESSLNQMFELEKYYSTFPKGSKTFGAEEGSGGSSRKRRMKIKKPMSKKRDSGSDGLTLSGSDSAIASPPGKQSSTLVKSNSLSGGSKKQRDIDVLDSMTDTETEEEAYRLMAPTFRLGPNAGAVSVAAEQEQLSLNWDSYQDKYHSEAYSEEPLDSDTSKKFLEFGEDYGKVLGNQSDCASIRSCSLSGRSRSKIDSDSDVDEIRQTLQQSFQQLNLWNIKFNKTIGSLACASDVAFDDHVHKTFLDEIIGTCKRNVECLTKLLIEVKDEILLAKEYNYILRVGGVFLASDGMTSLLSSFNVQPENLNAANMVSVQVQTDYVKESWETLKSTAEMHKAKQLKREMDLLKEELLDLAATVETMETTVTCREELEAKVTQVQNDLNLMKRGKKRLLQANVSVHRFLASSSCSDVALREEVTELYQLWDQTFCKISSQLFNLQSLSQTWHDFEDHLAQLQCALRTDTLKVLDFALKYRNPSTGMSISLQDIAGILSDKESESKDSLSMAELPSSNKLVVPILTALSTEGSLSDSGISDSGSEQELSEREKRLAQLKRLAKKLETILAPGSQALSLMFKRIEQAESELRELQKTCRDLIVRSASTEEIKMIVASTPTLANLEVEKRSLSVIGKESGKSTTNITPAHPTESSKDLKVGRDETQDCDSGKPNKKFWLWRLLRYALPFQLAFVAFFCIASVLEPQCCDSLNNLELSLNPQVRYDSGPPPL